MSSDAMTVAARGCVRGCQPRHRRAARARATSHLVLEQRTFTEVVPGQKVQVRLRAGHYAHTEGRRSRAEAYHAPRQLSAGYGTRLDDIKYVSGLALRTKGVMEQHHVHTTAAPTKCTPSQ